MSHDAEVKRLEDAKTNNIPWKKWGPYLSERQWGTVREDYSQDGNAWDYFSHDQARSRAYRWGEDGIAGISDDHQILCFCLSLWNGQDSIIKERLFGLTNSEGNHGEDVKEYYFYLDNTPTHSYMKYLYKYPQMAYPYDEIVRENKHRNRHQDEYELLDTGVFDDNRYFDVFVEYAKESPEDILIQITLFNRAQEDAFIHVLPTLWYRNTWSWKDGGSKPVIKKVSSNGNSIAQASHTDEFFRDKLSDYYLYCKGDVELLFTENDTNNERIFKQPNETPYVKDGINNFIVSSNQKAINPEQQGSKVAAHYQIKIEAGQSVHIQLRLAKVSPEFMEDPFSNQFDQSFNSRREEADAFYQSVIPGNLSKDRKNIVRQAISGMLWSKQYYYFELDKWLEEHGVDILQSENKNIRNQDWYHMINDDIISMPDKWEYPWYAAWDLAFHTMSLSMVDEDFAKNQLELMLKGYYLHPSGAIPAYEWNFSDVNPPVHAFASIFLYRIEQALHQKEDTEFLKRIYGKLMMNYSWWINRKDRLGKNLYEGGFLGLDNIGVFDRSSQLPTGGYLEQADATSWMALFCQNMIEMGIELSSRDKIYDELSFKFLDQLIWIARSINKEGKDSMWDEEDGFYYDILRLPDNSAIPLKVRSIVGLLPFCATTITEPWQRECMPQMLKNSYARFQRKPELFKYVHPTGPGHFGVGDRGIISFVNQDKLKRILNRLLDENEFLSSYGIRALSKYHKDHPYKFYVNNQEYSVSYLPGESDSGMFGGNSNWRGPIWMPMNVLIIRALLNFYLYYGDNFKIECPTGSGNLMNLFEVAREIVNRLSNIFERNESGQRPLYGGSEKFQNDPYWQDCLLFYEYFHGDNGSGLGASHQTGWTGLIARLIQIFALLDPEKYLIGGKKNIHIKQ